MFYRSNQIYLFYKNNNGSITINRDFKHHKQKVINRITEPPSDMHTFLSRIEDNFELH